MRHSTTGGVDVSLQKVPKAARAGGARWPLLAVVVMAALSGCGRLLRRRRRIHRLRLSRASTWPTPARCSGPINGSNVSELEVAWTLPLTGRKHLRQLRLDPDHQQGRHLLPGPGLQRAGDRPRQRRRPVDEEVRRPRATARTALVVADGLVYGATASEAFALDQETGKQVWSTPAGRQSRPRASTWRPATTTARSTSRPCR